MNPDFATASSLGHGDEPRPARSVSRPPHRVHENPTIATASRAGRGVPRPARVTPLPSA